MGFRKYTDDYRLENRPGKNGKMKTVAVYHGDEYDYTQPQEVLTRMKRIYGILSCAAIALELVLLALSPLIPGEFRPAAMPMVLLLLPLFFAVRAVCTLWFCKAPLLREQADRISKGLPPGALFLMILAFVAFGILLASMIVTGFTVPLLFYTLAAAALTGVALVMFLLRKNLTVEATKRKSK